MLLSEFFERKGISNLFWLFRTFCVIFILNKNIYSNNNNILFDIINKINNVNDDLNNSNINIIINRIINIIIVINNIIKDNKKKY